MYFNRKIIVAVGLISSVVVLASMTAIQQQGPPPQQQRVDPKLVNIKVLPKKMTYRQVDHLMDEWANSLGVRCTFCHAQDKASDEKPEKLMARKMYEMTAKINSKFFKAKKDSLKAVIESNVNCYTCHRGVSHPEIMVAPTPPRPQRPPGQGGPGGQRPGGQAAPAGQGTPPPAGQQGTPPPAGGQGSTTTPPPAGLKTK